MSGLGDHVPRRWLRWLVGLAIAALALWIVDSAARVVLPVARRVLDVIDPVVVAFALAYVLDPVVDWFESKGRSRTFAIWIVTLAGLVVIVGTCFVVLPIAVEQAVELWPVIRRRTDELAQGIAAQLGQPWVEALARLKRLMRDEIAHPDVEALGTQAEAIFTSGKRLAALALDVVLVPILTVYLLKDMDGIKARLAGLIPPHRRTQWLEPLLEIDNVLTGFVRGQMKVAALLAIMYTAGLFATQTPFALALGLVAGVLSIVPYLGVAVTLVPALALNVLAHSDPKRALGVLATFGIAQFVEGNFITPRVMSRTIGIHPVLVIASLLVGGAFFGITGMVLAIPASAAALVLLRRAHSRYASSDWYRNPPDPSRNRRSSDPP